MLSLSEEGLRNQQCDVPQFSCNGPRTECSIVSFTQAEVWTNIHLGTAIICACLPTYGLLFQHLKIRNSGTWSYMSSFFHSRRGLLRSKAEGTNKHRTTHQKLLESTEDAQHLGTNAAWAPNLEHHGSTKRDSIEMGSIVVRNTVKVTSTFAKARRRQSGDLQFAEKMDDSQ